MQTSLAQIAVVSFFLFQKKDITESWKLLQKKTKVKTQIIKKIWVLLQI